MPTNRNVRTRRPSPSITELEWAYINDAELPDGTERHEVWELEHDFGMFHGKHGKPVATDLWNTYGKAVVQRWALENPGRRPSCWWRFDAPEDRLRVGGVGSVADELPAYRGRRVLGVPTTWISAELADYYNRPPEKRGDRYVGPPGATVPANYKPPSWQPAAFVGFDHDNPPTFESQAAYLRRLRLLLPGEAARLTDADFEPEAVTWEASI